MSTVIGHGLAGALAAATITASVETRNRRWLIVFGALVAVVPDLDVVIYLLLSPEGMAIHRGLSHSVAFALASAALGTLCCFRILSASVHMILLALAFAALTHPLLDYLMGAGPPIAFLSPLLNHGSLLPVVAMPVAYYATSLRGLVSLLTHPPTILAVLLELATFVPLLLLALRYRRVSRACLWMVALSAELFTLVFYNWA